MNKYSVKLMNRALQDLDKIYSYVAKTLSEPKIALDLIDTIEQEIFTLEFMPYRCPERKTGFYANKGYRQLLVKNYTAIYRIDEAAKTVVVVTVRYSPSQF